MSPDILSLLHALSSAGLWLRLDEPDTLRLGPSALVKQQGELLQQVKAQKAEVIAAIRTMQVHALFCTKDLDPRFASAVCPECQQSVYVILKPRRLSAHRLPDGQTVCPGSERAQLICAEQILEAFITDRCVERPGGLLTWTSLKGALSAWCVERDVWLPPPQYLQQWMSQRYELWPERDQVMWRGLGLSQQEWLGDQDEAPQAAVRPVAPPKKARLRVPGGAEQTALL